MRTRTHRPAPRRGFALAVALFALVVIGALIAGVFFASTQEFRIGRNTLTQQRAFAAAEYGLNNAISTWNTDSLRAVGIGQSRTSAFSNAGMAGTVKVTRLGTMSFWVVSEGLAGPNSAADARRRTNGVVRLSLPQVNFLGALTFRGSARIGGSSQITGVDENPAGWNCPPTQGSMPGVVVDSSASITYSGNAYSITGSPAVAYDARARDTSTYLQYGESDWEDLVRSATVRIPHNTTIAVVAPDSVMSVVNGVTTKRCKTELSTNWGQTSRTTTPGICERYFPIIYAAGDLHVNGGKGQGVLLVEGDLNVQGGFEFFGPVIVKGRLRTSGTGGHFNGGVMAANVDLETNTVLGNAEVTYSRCAIITALMGVGTPQLVTQRSWAELY